MGESEEIREHDLRNIFFKLVSWDALEPDRCDLEDLMTDEYQQIRSRYPHLFVGAKTDFPWETLKMRPSVWDVFSGYYQITLFVAWVSALSGPTLWRYFLPQTVIEGPLAIKDVLAGMFRKHSTVYSGRSILNFSQDVILLSQSSAALAQFCALVLGLPLLAVFFISLGQDNPSPGWLPFLDYLLLFPFLLVGWPMLLGVFILLGIAFGLALALISLLIKSILDML